VNNLDQNREKEIFSDPSNIILTVNGVQVWIDNKFEDELLDEDRFDSSSEKINAGGTDITENK
jgi:hypothetical protein